MENANPTQHSTTMKTNYRKVTKAILTYLRTVQQATVEDIYENVESIHYRINIQNRIHDILRSMVDCGLINSVGYGVFCLNQDGNDNNKRKLI